MRHHAALDAGEIIGQLGRRFVLRRRARAQLGNGVVSLAARSCATAANQFAELVPRRDARVVLAPGRRRGDVRRRRPGDAGASLKGRPDAVPVGHDVGDNRPSQGTDRPRRKTRPTGGDNANCYPGAGKHDDAPPLSQPRRATCATSYAHWAAQNTRKTRGFHRLGKIPNRPYGRPKTSPLPNHFTKSSPNHRAKITST